MKTLALLIFVSTLAGCQQRVVTTYFCATQEGYVSFNDLDNTVIDHGDYVKVFTDSEIYTFRNCNSQKERQ